MFYVNKIGSKASQSQIQMQFRGATISIISCVLLLALTTNERKLFPALTFPVATTSGTFLSISAGTRHPSLFLLSSSSEAGFDTSIGTNLKWVCFIQGGVEPMLSPLSLLSIVEGNHSFFTCFVAITQDLVSTVIPAYTLISDTE